MEAIDSNGSNSGTSFKELTLSLAEKSIERILELSEDTQTRRREVAQDSLAFNTRTETIVHTTLWLENFTTFLEQLSTVA
jgi:hypothetical protein